MRLWVGVLSICQPSASCQFFQCVPLVWYLWGFCPSVCAWVVVFWNLRPFAFAISSSLPHTGPWPPPSLSSPTQSSFFLHFVYENIVAFPSPPSLCPYPVFLVSCGCGTNDHKLGWFKTTEIYSRSFGGQKSSPFSYKDSCHSV